MTVYLLVWPMNRELVGVVTVMSCPDISVVVPVYNDPNGIQTTLRSLVEQTYPDSSYEVLPVDNGSTDETPAVINSFATESSPVEPLSEPDIQSSYAARNRGIEHATGRTIAFIDADMWVDEDWVERIATKAEETESVYMGCNVELVPENDPPTIPEQYNAETGFPVESYIRHDHFAPTCCLVVQSQVFDEVGLFDERMISSGDKEFGWRVHQRGIKQQFVPDITMYHPTRCSLLSLCRKAYRVGKGQVQLRRRHSMSPNHGTTETLLDELILTGDRIPTIYPFGFYLNHRPETDARGIDLLCMEGINKLELISRIAGRLNERVESIP